MLHERMPSEELGGSQPGPADLAILTTIAGESRPREQVVQAASEVFVPQKAVATATIDEVEAAFIACLNKDWIQIVDEAALLHAIGHVVRKGACGPLDGWPVIGDVDLTLSGFEILQRSASSSYRARPTSGVEPETVNGPHWRMFVHSTALHVFLSLEAAIRYVHTGQSSEQCVVGSVASLCSLRSAWWDQEVPSFGVVVTSDAAPRWEKLRIDPSWFRRECDTLSTNTHVPSTQNDVRKDEYEYAVLRAVANEQDGPPRTRAQLVERVSKLAQNNSAEGDDAIQVSIDACFQNGLIAVVDDHLADEMHPEVGGTPCWWPLMGGEIGLTRVGADRYLSQRMSSRGESWKDDVHWELTLMSCWDVISTSKSKIILPDELRQFVCNSRSSVPEEIGPWCVRWYDIRPEGWLSSHVMGSLQLDSAFLESVLRGAKG